MKTATGIEVTFYKQTLFGDFNLIKSTIEVDNINYENDTTLKNHFSETTIDLLFKMASRNMGENSGLECTERVDGSEYINDRETGEIYYDSNEEIEMYGFED